MRLSISRKCSAVARQILLARVGAMDVTRHCSVYRTGGRPASPRLLMRGCGRPGCLELGIARYKLCVSLPPHLLRVQCRHTSTHAELVVPTTVVVFVIAHSRRAGVSDTHRVGARACLRRLALVIQCAHRHHSSVVDVKTKCGAFSAPSHHTVLCC